MERTLIIFKPDAIKRRMVSKLIKIWEQKGYNIVATRLFQPTKEQMTQHYQEHQGKPFFDALVQRMSSDKCLFFIIEGPSVIKWSRAVLGATDPNQADVHSIRGAFATHYTENLVHASDSEQSAEREIALWQPYL
jgi:nucleoside-diphosphate kinase